MKYGGYILFIIFLFIALFFISQDNQTEIEENISGKDENNLMNVTQNVKFKNLPITYSIDVDSSKYNSRGMLIKSSDNDEIRRIKWALEIIENSSDGIIKFQEVESYENPNIKIVGLPPLKDYTSDDRFITEGLAGPTDLSEDGYIIQSEVELFATEIGYWKANKESFGYEGYSFEYVSGYEWEETLSWVESSCVDFPFTEIHEILHAMGFGHQYDSHLVMSPIKHKIQACKIKGIDNKTSSCLKYLYSYGHTVGSCEGVNLYPNWREEESIQDNFKWSSLPIKYSITNCSERQKQNLQKAEIRLETFSNRDIYRYIDSNISDVDFRCEILFDDVILNEETDFWETTNYFPAAQPYYYFENDSIKSVEIILFAQDRKCGGIEIHEFLHALGIREHSGVWMEKETALCSNSLIIHDDETTGIINELYGLNFTY